MSEGDRHQQDKTNENSNDEQQQDFERIAKKLPDECPVCRQFHGMRWTEFRVAKTTFVFIADRTVQRSLDNDVFKIICTKCGEQVEVEHE